MRWLKRRQNANGTVRWYVVRPGRKPVRMPDAPHDSADFLLAYAEAIRDTVTARIASAEPGSVAAVALAYKTGAAWRDLRPSSREQRDREIRRLVEKAGALSIRSIGPKHIRSDLATLTPGAASNRLRAWRALFRQALDMELVEADPSAAVRSPRRSPGHTPWTAAEIEAFRARWPVGTEQRLALELGLWTGARVGDLVRLGWQHVGRDGWLSWIQEKTGGEVSLPFTATPPAGLEAEHAHLMAALEIARGRMLFLSTRSGAARSKKAFASWLRGACEAADIPAGYTAHGWRKTRLTSLAEAGWTPHEIGAWSGHQTLKEVEGYTRSAARRRMIESAGRERVPPTSGNAREKGK